MFLHTTITRTRTRTLPLQVLNPLIRQQQQQQRIRTLCTLTLFTRINCGLCNNAKNEVIKLHKRKPFEYQELDVMISGNEIWKNAYEFDVPVLHVQRLGDTEIGPRKLFHRFTEEEVEGLIDSVERGE